MNGTWRTFRVVSVLENTDTAECALWVKNIRTPDLVEAYAGRREDAHLWLKAQHLNLAVRVIKWQNDSLEIVKYSKAIIRNQWELEYP